MEATHKPHEIHSRIDYSLNRDEEIKRRNHDIISASHIMDVQVIGQLCNVSLGSYAVMDLKHYPLFERKENESIWIEEKMEGKNIWIFVSKSHFFLLLRLYFLFNKTKNCIIIHIFSHQPSLVSFLSSRCTITPCLV